MKLHTHTDKKTALSQAAAAIRSVSAGGADVYVSGGSSFQVFKELDCSLTAEEKQGVSIYQVDERYGSTGHKDANWLLLRDVDVAAFRSCLLYTSDAADD